MARRPGKQATSVGPTSGPAPPPQLAALRKELYALADPADAIHLQRFFKTAPGEYGAGDKFLGLRVPALRRLVKEYRELADAEALEMLASSWHEERLLALMLLVHQHSSGDSARRDRIHRRVSRAHALHQQLGPRRCVCRRKSSARISTPETSLSWNAWPDQTISGRGESPLSRRFISSSRMSSVPL